jgi:amino acid adenylation domain-containing protein/thioester reductase-like protein
MVRTPDLSVSGLSLLGGDERRRLVEFFNAPRAGYQREILIHELFEAQVQRAPNAVAVTFGEKSLTYSELNHKANQLAHYLHDKRVGPDTLVGLYVDRGIEMVIGILGILKAGGAFVALEPLYPLERLQYMLKDAKPALLLTQQHIMSRVPEITAEVVQLDHDWKIIERRPGTSVNGPALGLDAGNLAYVIYTSGSTGQPKGVMVEHRNVTRLFAATDEWFHFNERDIWTLFHSVAFDFSVWELWGALLYGGRVVVVPYMTARSPREFYRLLCEQDVTVLNQTPSSFSQLIEAQAQNPERRHNLRLVIFGGEALELYKLRRWAERNGIRRPQLVNMYGITETTVHVTYRPLTDEEIRSDATSPIGRPIPDLQLYLLDAHREPVPIGVVGEIYVGGAGVARGYLNRPELTAERFIADPFSRTAHSRLYKSGDLGRRRPDGTVEYLGRNDHQVKIRGFRIELGEIEAQLARHEQVKEAVVLAREDVAGEKRLVAYVVPREITQIGASPGTDELRAHLRSVLPEYMLPTAFVALPSIPLTSNGKLDRKALPAPNADAYVRSQYESPLGEVERGLAEIWQQLLQVERVGRKDNFFELGGHSLLVITLLSKIQQFFGAMLKVADVYKSPTLQELSMRICGGAAADDLVNLSQEATLSSEVQPIPGPISIPPRVVLLTGATGFVGRFLLAQLLQYEDATIHCLVRASSRQQAAERIKNTLMRWDLWKEEFERRIVAIPGDLSLPRLGLDEASYRFVAEKVESIYHCATSMNHLETYTMAKPANVHSAAELLKLATHGNRKVINYVSTISVFSSDGTNEPRVVTESTSIDREQHRASHGYAASKWVAEKIFMIASERGIPCNIFRLGLVWADTKKGRYDDLQREYRILKSCLLLGYGIKNYRYPMAPTPVDYVARAVVSLANRHPDGRGIFHISSSRQGLDGVFECCNEIPGTRLQLKAVPDWIAALKRLHHSGVTLPAMPLIESAFTIDETESAGSHVNIGLSHSNIDCSKTYCELERDGIFAPEFNDHLVRLCVEDMLIRDEDLRESIGADRKPIKDQRHKPLVGLSSS